MNEKYNAIVNQFHGQNPPLTKEECERRIAQCVGEDINEALKDVTAGENITSFQQAMQDTFGITCEIVPALSLYVNLNDRSDEAPSITPFSSLPFEQRLGAILEKDPQSTSSAEIIARTEEAINESCDYFLNAVLLTNPLLMKIHKRLVEEFHEKTVIRVTLPVQILSKHDVVDAITPDGHRGTYL